MDSVHKRGIRAPLAGGRTRDLLPVRRPETHGSLRRSRSEIWRSQAVVPDARSHRRDTYAHALRAQPRRPAVPRERRRRRSGPIHNRRRQLDCDAEEVMAKPNFQGLRVLALERRRSHEIASLMPNFGGRPLVAPALREVPLESNHEALAFATALIRGEFEVVIFLTGVGTRVLVNAVERARAR